MRQEKETQGGLRRIRAKNSFIYKNENGRTIQDSATIQRIKKLRIPPAWQDVWIAKNPKSKLQATGYDTRKRKQYIYHPNFREKQERTKFKKITEFAKALPAIRKQVLKDLKRPALDRRKVSAAVIYLMEATLIRVGNDRYAKENNSYGLTTLRDKHVKIRGDRLIFEFKGKSSKNHKINLRDKRVASLVKRCRDLKGGELFQYLDKEGKVHDIKASHINSYLKSISGKSFSAKDFRTWAGTVLAAAALAEIREFDPEAGAKLYIKCAIESVAKKLGNTPAICRKCYIHPELINCFADETILKTLRKKVESTLRSPMRGLTAQEGAVLAFLQRRIR